MTILETFSTMSGSLNADDKDSGQQPPQNRASFSSKMQRSFKKVNRNIEKKTGTEPSTTVELHRVFVEKKTQDEERQSLYVFPDRLSSLTCRTGFTKDEIRKLYLRFLKQHCPRGAVTTNDLKPAYAKLFLLGDSTKYAQIVFDTFDRDGNGIIVSFGDLSLPRFYDLNRDGYITKKEMLIIISAIYEMLRNGQAVPNERSQRHVNKVFEKMDIDKDGVISQEEFTSSCKHVRIL